MASRMASSLRLWRTLLALLLTLFSLAYAIAAQSETQPEGLSLPWCLTNVDAKGSLIAGLYGTVASPVSYENVISGSESITIFPGNRSGLHTEIHAYDVFKSSASDGTRNSTSLSRSTILTFLRKDETEAYSCLVQIVEFNPDLHNLEDLEFGNCELVHQYGAKAPIVGHVQIIELPEDVSEVSGRPRAIIDAGPLIDRSVQVRGQAEGLGSLSWNKGTPDDREASIYEIGGVCPYWVTQPTSTDENKMLEATPFCQDVNGEDIVLAVDGRATLLLSEYSRNINFFSGSLTQILPPIEVVTQLVFGSPEVQEFEVIASKPGLMTLVRLIYYSEERKLTYEACKVIVIQ